jgi:hypothetical protein
MSKKNAQRSRQRQSSNPNKKRRLVLLSVVISLTALGLVSASIRDSRFSASNAVTPPAPSGFEPGSPAKEYIYAGGRLVATEEPAQTPTPTPPPPCTPPTGIIISEFRLRGALGATDEFVELYNNTDQVLTICTADGSNGWAVVSSDGLVRFVVPYNTTIPARGHYLAVGGAYSLGAYASADLSVSSDISDNKGLALFNTANPTNFNISTRRDAAGFTVDGSLYREGGGLQAIGTTNGEYSFARKLTSGIPQDTGDNAADFDFIATNGGTYGGVVAILGAPGPENVGSPIQRNAAIKATLIDPAVSSAAAPNRVRDTTAVGPNATLGTLIIRRQFTNNTGTPVTRLRFRVADVTTLNSPGYVPGGSQADLRALSSGNITVTLSNGTQVLVQGTTVETPPTQPSGGGLNSSVAAGVITVSQPLVVGANVKVQFVLGVQQGGSFRFTVNVEGLP